MTGIDTRLRQDLHEAIQRRDHWIAELAKVTGIVGASQRRGHCVYRLKYFNRQIEEIQQRLSMHKSIILDEENSIDADNSAPSNWPYRANERVQIGSQVFHRGNIVPEELITPILISSRRVRRAPAGRPPARLAAKPVAAEAVTDSEPAQTDPIIIYCDAAAGLINSGRVSDIPRARDLIPPDVDRRATAHYAMTIGRTSSYRREVSGFNEYTAGLIRERLVPIRPVIGMSEEGMARIA